MVTGYDFSHTINSAVRGFHVYKYIWMPFMNEALQARQQLGYSEDAYAVVKNTGTGEIVIGHVPREISRICWYFLQNDGEISCTITTADKRRTALVQGGFAVQCSTTLLVKRNISISYVSYRRTIYHRPASKILIQSLISCL